MSGCRWTPNPPPLPLRPRHSLMAMCTESSGCAAVSAQMWRLCTASTPATASSVSCTALKSIPLGVPGEGELWVLEGQGPQRLWVAPWHRPTPQRVPTLHEDEEDVTEDGQCCPQHQCREEEGADGIHILVLGLKGVGEGEAPLAPQIPVGTSREGTRSLPSHPCAWPGLAEATVPMSPASPLPPLTPGP